MTTEAAGFTDRTELDRDDPAGHARGARDRLPPLTTEQLRLIAHGLEHLDSSHGNLGMFALPLRQCDDPATWVRQVGYRDTRRVFEELADLRGRHRQKRAGTYANGEEKPSPVREGKGPKMSEETGPWLGDLLAELGLYGVLSGEQEARLIALKSEWDRDVRAEALRDATPYRFWTTDPWGEERTERVGWHDQADELWYAFGSEGAWADLYVIACEPLVEATR